MEQQKKDVFREVPLRYLGYANELGEAFRHMVPVRVVYLSYIISSGYVLSHAMSQGFNAHRTHAVTLEPSQFPGRHSHHNLSVSKCTVNSTKVSPSVAFIDTLVWQGLASVLIPGLVINKVCAVSRIMLIKNARQLAMKTRKWIVCGIGISTIPLIIHPIDSAVDKLMNSLVRPVCLRLTTQQ